MFSIEVVAVLSFSLLASLASTTETPESSGSTGSYNESAINKLTSEQQDVAVDDSGTIAWIVIGVLVGLVAIASVVGFFVYKQYVRRNVKSMNFDNPVYRKTTEDNDHFSLEKNQYQPARSYATPVSEETLEPLNNPGTNEFV